MSRMMKTALLLVTVLGCSSDDELPSENPPPTWGVPISGGNLHVTRDGAAVVTDPDRDRILMVDLATQNILAEVPVPGDEPGRIVEDGAGRVHVALRRGGAVLTFANGRSPEVLARRAVCAEPRGLAWQAATDQVHVACASGELVSLLASGGAPVRTKRLDRDLRDVVVSNGQLVATKFRSSELMTIDAQGSVVTRTSPPIVQRFGFRPDGPTTTGAADAVPAVAWRTVTLPNGKLLVSHQRQVKGQLSMETGGYGGGCDGSSGPVESALTLIEPGLPPSALAPIASGALPVDLAASPNGQLVAVATAGNNKVSVAPVSVLASRDKDMCRPPHPDDDDKDDDGLGAPTSVTFTPGNDLVIIYPEAPALVVRGVTSGKASQTIMLPGEIGYDAGRQVFHGQTAIGLACASCHPEARDDGRVWTFEGVGTRRTQNLAGSILQRGPYHWVGDEKDLGVLMDDVFANRMGGGEVTRSQKLSLGPWLDRVPAPAPTPMIDVTAVERGRTVFVSAGCETCHGGALLTNNQLFDVGTGGKFKVPSLVGISARAPFMHTGCAATLRDRFSGGCGGGDRHGTTSTLTAGQIDDLVAYLESL